MKKCELCERNFPSNLIQTMTSLQGQITACPICLLVERNKIHGLPLDTKFHGEEANETWLKAKQFIAKADGKR